MMKPRQFSQEEINAATETKRVVIEESNQVWKGIYMAGEISVSQDWLTANAQIAQRLETIYNRMDGEQDGIHAVAEGMEQLQQLIRELKA